MPADKPQFPIKPILEHYGFDNVPDIYHGHAKVRCAFHGDRNPSASVSRYGFTCWACGRTGDAIKLVREEEGLNYQDAVRRCAEIADTETATTPSKPGWGSLLS